MTQPVTTAANRRRGLALTHLAAFLAGFTGLFGKAATADPALLTTGRAIVAAPVLLLISRLGGSSLRMSARDNALALLSGAFLAGHWLTFFQAIRVSGIAVGLLAYAAYPVLVVLLEPALFQEKRRGAEIPAVLLLLGGLGLLTASADTANATRAGVAWGALSGALCAGYALLSRSLAARHTGSAISARQQAAVALFASPFALLSPLRLTGESILLVLALGLVFTVTLQMLFVNGLRHIPARTSAFILMLEPLYSILFAVVWPGEIPSPLTLAGGALILGATLLITCARHPADTRPAAML